MKNENTLEERKAQNLLNIRGYKLLKREEQGEHIISLLAEVQGGKKLALIWCILDRVIGVAYVDKLKKTMEATEADEGIIVTCTRYTFAAKRRAQKHRIELIPKHFPVFNIFKHKLVPKHEILTPEEAKELLKRYRAEPHKFPMIKASDIVAIAIGAKPGEILRIIRESPTAGNYVSYRYVVPS